MIFTYIYYLVSIFSIFLNNGNVTTVISVAFIILNGAIIHITKVYKSVTLEFITVPICIIASSGIPYTVAYKGIII